MPDPDTIRLILVCLSFILVLGTLVKPFCGLIGYLIIMMTRPGLFYPALGEARVELLVGVFLILVMILSGRVKSIRPSDDRTTKLVFILLVVMALSMIQAMDFGTSWDRMHEFLKVFMFFLMIIAFTETEKEIESLLWVFGIVTAFFAYDAIHNYLEGNLVLDIGGDRVDYAVTSGGMGSGHVGLANMIAQGMPVIWYMGVLNKKLLLRLTGILLFCICLYGVVISGSRGGFVGLVTIAACLVVFSKNRLPIILGCLGVFFAVPLVSHSGYMNYIGTILDMGRTTDVSSNSRITGLRNGFEMLLKRPLLGVGPGCYPIARRAWFGWGLWSHNTYGEVMGSWDNRLDQLCEDLHEVSLERSEDNKGTSI
jgi:O-antigen ligase